MGAIPIRYRTPYSARSTDTSARLVGESASVELRPGCPEGRVLVGEHEAAIAEAGIGEPTIYRLSV